MREREKERDGGDRSNKNDRVGWGQSFYFAFSIYEKIFIKHTAKSSYEPNFHPAKKNIMNTHLEESAMSFVAKKMSNKKKQKMRNEKILV